MEELEREAVAKNIVTETELKKIQMELEQADAEGVFFGYCCMTLVAGQKPG